MPTPSNSPPSNSSPSGSESPPPSGSSPSPTVSPPPIPTTKPPSGGATFRGQVEEGVEAGCLMLNVNGKIYQLLGGDRTMLRPGRRVEVTGAVQPDLATTCQQGIPLVVREVRAA
jgi:hypothetical protein